MSGAVLSERDYRALINKQRVLPQQLTRARSRVRQLESEARRYGLHELVEAGR